MSTRTVRLDKQAEIALKEIQDATAMPISEVLKQGLRALQEEVRRETGRTAYDLYSVLDLGPGGYARASSREAKRAVKHAIRAKLDR